MWHLPGLGSCRRDPRGKRAQGRQRGGVSGEEFTGIPTPNRDSKSLASVGPLGNYSASYGARGCWVSNKDHKKSSQPWYPPSLQT